MIQVNHFPEEVETGKKAFGVLINETSPFNMMHTPLRLPSTRDQPAYPGERDRQFIGYVYATVETPAEYASVLALNAVRFATLKIEPSNSGLYCTQGTNHPYIITDTYVKGNITKSSVSPFVEDTPFSRQSLEVRPMTVRDKLFDRLRGFGTESLNHGDFLSAAISLDTLEHLTGIPVTGCDVAKQGIASRKAVKRRVLFTNEPLLGPPMPNTELYSAFMSSADGFAEIYSSLA